MQRRTMRTSLFTLLNAPRQILDKKRPRKGGVKTQLVILNIYAGYIALSNSSCHVIQEDTFVSGAPYHRSLGDAKNNRE